MNRRLTLLLASLAALSPLTLVYAAPPPVSQTQAETTSLSGELVKYGDRQYLMLDGDNPIQFVELRGEALKRYTNEDHITVLGAFHTAYFRIETRALEDYRQGRWEIWMDVADAEKTPGRKPPLSEELPISTLTALLGHDIEDETVQSFVTRLGMGKYRKFDSGGFDWSNPKPQAVLSPFRGTFSLLFRNNRISRVVIPMTFYPGLHRPYPGRLPFGAKPTDSPADIRGRAGRAEQDSIQPDGSGFLSYPLGQNTVQFQFHRQKIAEIYLDAKSTVLN